MITATACIAVLVFIIDFGRLRNIPITASHSPTIPHGEDGFPANLDVEVTYTIQNSSLLISYQAILDNATPIALTNHAYFNLDGFGDSIKEHTIQIWADKYTEANDKLIPTGNRPSVTGTPLT